MQSQPTKAEPPKRKRRWLQFSLRTLLVFTLICAIAFAWLGRKIERKRIEGEAVEAIQRLGGEVLYDYQSSPAVEIKDLAEPNGPGWLRSVLGKNFFSEVDFVQFESRLAIRDSALERLDQLTEVKVLNLGGARITDAGLDHVKGLNHLQFLLLSQTDIGDAGLARLKRSTSLQTLALLGTKVTDDGMTNVAGLAELQTLDVSHTTVGDAGLLHLNGLVKLESLDLDSSHVTDAGMATLEGFVNLKHIYLNGTDVGDDGIKHLKGLKQLEWLRLKDTHVSDAALEVIKRFTHLIELDLRGTKVSDAGLKELRTTLPKCKILH